jgi:hypothetical protein
MYTPHVGRWLSQDPAGYIDGPNRYLYVANDPATKSDPTGLFPGLLPSEQQLCRMCPSCRCKTIEIFPIGWQTLRLSYWTFWPFYRWITVLGFLFRVNAQTTGDCTCRVEQSIDAKISTKLPGSAERQSGGFSGYEGSCPGNFTAERSQCDYPCWPDTCQGLISYRDAPGGTVAGYVEDKDLVGFEVDLKRCDITVCCVDPAGTKLCTTKKCRGGAKIVRETTGLSAIRGAVFCN